MRPAALTLLLAALAGGCVPAPHNVVEDVQDNRTQRFAERRRMDYVNAHPELLAVTKEAILEGDVHEGMLMEEVRASWGVPEREGRLDIDGRAVRIWEYGTVGATFEEGVLSGFRDLGRRSP